MPAKSPFPDRREVLAATAAVAASSLSPRQRTQRPQATKSARSRLMSRKTSASSCAGASWRPAGLSGKRSRITHKACRLRAYHKLILLQPNKGGPLRPGNSRNSSQKRFARASDHCAHKGG